MARTVIVLGVVVGLLAGAGRVCAQPGDGQDRGRLFSLPRSQDEVFEWNKARADIAAGAYRDAVERLLGLLRRDSGGVVSLDDTFERFMGLRMAVVTTLRDLPEEARIAYDKLVEREAGDLLHSAFTARSTDELQRLATQFPASTAGRRAALRLGDLALEAGDGPNAQIHYLAALDGMQQGSDASSDMQTRMLAARAVAGGTNSVVGLTPEQRARVAAIDEALPTRGARELVRGWPSYTDRGPMPSPSGKIEPRWRQQINPMGFDANVYAMHAVGGLSGLFVTDGQSLFALDALTGEELWRADGPMLADNEARDYAESINPDVALAAACSEDVVVAALQTPTEGTRYYFRSIDVIKRIPARRLHAFDRATGKLIWSHFDRLNGPVANRFTGHDIAGPPLVSGDTIYVPAHDQTGAVAYYLSAYDLHTGEPKWRQLICSSQGAVNMFGNALMEFGASPLALRDGIIFGATNLGAVFAADARDGRVRWLTAYEVIELPETRLTNQRMREVYFANSAVAVADGVMACTPIDSAYGLGFDAKTGEPLWRMFYRSPARETGDMRWLLGAIGDEFIFSGVGVVAVKARPESAPRLRATARLVKSADALNLRGDYNYAPPLPRGALTADRIFLPAPTGLIVFNRDGDLDQLTDKVSGDGKLGNLLLVDGLIVSVRTLALTVSYDAGQLMRDAEQLVDRSPDNAAAILCLASLTRAAAGDNLEGAAGDAAVRFYQRGLEVARRTGMNQTSPLYRRMANELFQLTLTRAQRLAQRSPDRALATLRAARDAAPDSGQWIEAEKQVLDMLVDQPEAYLEELELLGREHGSQEHDFKGLGRIPVAVYVLWESVDLAEPGDAIARCQDLIERYGDVRLGARTARELGSERQHELIASHGRSIYTAVEARAAEALARAGSDGELLRVMVATYPHSEAAVTAVRRMMDLAIERGDLASAGRAYSQAVAEAEPSPGLLRRMVEAARRAGNRPLGNAFAERLLAAHAQAASDLPADAGKTFGEVVALEPLPEPAPMSVQLPLRITAELRPQAVTATLHVREIEPASGFDRPGDVPLYLSVNTERLQAFDLARGAEMFAEPLFTIPHRYQLDREPLLLCGDTLLLPEGTEVRAIDYRSGEQRWTYAAGSGRLLTLLGIEAGTLHLFSELPGHGDGGTLIGVEPKTGAQLFRHVFPADQESTTPIASGGALWRVDSGDEPGFTRMDAVTGRITDAISLSSTLVRALDLNARTQASWLRQLPLKMFADADTLYLPLAAPSTESQPPRLAAIDFAGKLRWTPWVGNRGRLLRMVAGRDDVIVLIEDGASSRLVILDKDSGNVRKERPLGSNAQPLNWRENSRNRRAPATLLVMDNTSRAVNLNCLPLDNRPQFSYALRGSYTGIAQSPVLGADFLAIPAIRGAQRLSMFVVDLATRRSLLPEGATALPLSLRGPEMFQCGTHTVLQSNEGVTVLGLEGSEPR